MGNSLLLVLGKKRKPHYGAEATPCSRLARPSPALAPSMIVWATAYPHGPIHLAAIKHESEIAQIAGGNVPRNVLGFIRQVEGCAQGQSCVDMLCPGRGVDEDGCGKDWADSLRPSQLGSSTVKTSSLQPALGHSQSLNHSLVLEFWGYWKQ